MTRYTTIKYPADAARSMAVLAAIFRIRPSGNGLAGPGIIAVTSAVAAEAWVVGVNRVAVEMSVSGVEVEEKARTFLRLGGASECECGG